MAISTNWQVSLYFIQLIITAVETTDPDAMPIDVMINEEALQPPELWFNSDIIPQDYFKLYAKIVEIKGALYIEKFLVRVGRKQLSLNVAKKPK